MTRSVTGQWPFSGHGNQKWESDGLVCFEMFRNVFAVRQGQGIVLHAAPSLVTFDWKENGTSTGVTTNTYEANPGHSVISVALTTPDGAIIELFAIQSGLVPEKP